MNPIRLQLENFCGHSKSDISFDDFSSALVVGKIKGNEKFSNGAGKSTIFSAIKYVLFNEVNFSTLDKAIRHGTDYCKVTFDFMSPSDSEIYRIIRSKSKRSGSELRLHRKVGDNWEDLTQKKNQDTEKELSKILKINCKTFCNSVLFAQSDLSGLASLTPEKRKLALKEALQLNIYSKYESAAKEKTKILVKEIDKERTILSTIGVPIDDISKFKLELSEIDEKISADDARIILIKDFQKKENDIYLSLTKKFETLERQSAEFVAKHKILQDDIKNISGNIGDYNKKIFSVKESGKLLADESKDLSAVIDKISSLKFRNKSLIKDEIEKNTQLIINKKALYNTHLSKLEELKIPIPTGNICKHCRHKIEDRDACQKQIDIDIFQKKEQIKVSSSELDLLKEIEKKLSDELKSADSAEFSLANSKNLLVAKSKEIEIKRSLFLEYSNLIDQNNKFLSLKNEELIEIKKNQFIDNSEEFLKLKIDINGSKSKLISFSKDLEETNKSISLLSNNKAVLLHRIEERKKDIDKIIISEKKISDLEEKHIIHQKVIYAFGSGGIPALITHTILDDYQVESNNLLAKLRPGLQLQFSVIKDRDDGDKEDTMEISYVLDGFDVEYAQLSGAQQLLVALSLKLGLASIIKKRLGIEIRLLLIDEVDQSLDEGGLEAFEDAIKQLQQEFKILVITHNNDLKNKFNNAILVEQDEKFVSVARVVNTW